MNDDERIRDYLRRRADVMVPDDLQLTLMAPSPRPWWARAFASIGALGRAAIAAIAVAAVAILVSLPTLVGPSRPSAHPTEFPSVVAGLPVITVARADELLSAGELDGRTVAVAGFYQAFFPSCPFPGRYIGPLEGWCALLVFSDTRAGAQLCQRDGANGMSCQMPTGTHLKPFFVSETSGSVSHFLSGGPTGEPVRLVLIGHAGDPRQWHCTAATQGDCSRSFVVERVAWAEGDELPVAAPETGDQQSGQPITPVLTLAQVVAAVGLGDDVVTGAPFRAGDIATVDPRWNLAGDNVVWLVRSLEPRVSPDAVAHPETVWLIDDATGSVIDSHPLQLDPGFRPARLWRQATVHGYECCPGDRLAFYRVETAAGAVVYDGAVPGGASGGEGSTTFGGGYGSGPLLLLAGEYTVSAWTGTSGGGPTTPPNECSTEISVQALGDVALDAEFAEDAPCTFRPAPPRP